jgi:SAM-dependent methyltransferase
MERQPTIVDLFERLDRERQAADRQYNEALTALDRAHQTPAAVPTPPVFHDSSQIERLNAGWTILRRPPERHSGSLKGRLRNLVWRVVAPTLEAQQQFNAGVVEHLNRNVALHEQATQRAAELVEVARRQLEAMTRFEWLLLQFLQTVTGYVDTKDRSTGGPEFREQLSLLHQRLTMVERELSRDRERYQEVVEPSATQAADRPSIATARPVFADLESIKYVGFEDRFRGTPAEIRERLAPYLPLFTEADDVVDVGCGRGEFLELLRERGIRAHGVDTNQAMVDECRARGLSVERDDALSYLIRQPESGVGGLVAIQVVEHFEPAYLLKVLEAAYRKLRPGAPLVLETINPACWMAFFETYIRDLTHARPLHPDTLRYLVQAAGFVSVNVEYRQPVTENDRLDRVSSSPGDDETMTAIVAAVNAHADKLNTRLFSSMDYAVVARRG